MHRISFSVITPAVLLAMFVSTAGAGDAVRDHDIEAEDYFSIGVITGNAVSPDGGYVAYTELRWNPPDEKRNLDLWVVNTQTRQVRRLTFDKASDGFIRETIRHGRSNTRMRGFQGPAGLANLSDQEIDDIIIYLRELAKG